jgi:hypothetical protein
VIGPERETGRCVIPSKGYVIEIVTGPLDDIDRQLIADEAADNAGEGWG